MMAAWLKREPSASTKERYRRQGWQRKAKLSITDEQADEVKDP